MNLSGKHARRPLLLRTSPINREEINTALVATFSKEGDSVMKTIAQTYIDQGLEQGLELGRKQARQEMEQEIQRAQQEIQKLRQETQRLGLLSSIELGLELKFGKEGLGLFNEVQQIHRHASVAQDELTFGSPRRTQVRQRLRRAAQYLPACSCQQLAITIFLRRV